MQPWNTLSRETILDGGRFLRVEGHTIGLPDGRIISDWHWVVTPDFINIVVVTDAGTLLFFRQTKYAVQGTTLAPVGGYIEHGEEPLAAAQRELREELGYEAKNWHSLGTFVVDGNRGAGTAYFFLATGGYPGTKAVSDDLEEQEVVALTMAETREALRRGDFKVLPWTTVVALALDVLTSEQL